ncbi:hypothetical protein INT43_008813 [Umbelopsis isabellina]|uniref:Amino acid transporter n=1 Tax=Mortierella isabellina TaxID=91625 RepID=A0A8H7PWW5_MORIS|nr:hypothetical protein INT43_008813 [Umbelopsis isabellina]
MSKAITVTHYGSVCSGTSPSDNPPKLKHTVFNTFASFGLAFTNIGILSNLSASFQAGLLSGGPVAMVCSWNVVAFFMLCVSLSLAEICSAYPLNGIYHWAYELVNAGGDTGVQWAPFAAFLTGWIYCLAGIIATATADLAVALSISSMLRIFSEGSIELSKSSILLLAVGILIIHALLNIWDMQLISLMNEVSVWWSCGGLLVICAILANYTPKHNDIWWVLTDYENYTGFTSVPYVVMISMVCAGYTLFGCESVAQVAEETEEASNATPIAMVASIAVSWLVGLLFLVCLLFYTQDIQSIEDTQFAMPIAQLFLDAVGSRLTMILLFVLVVSQFFTGCTTVTVVSRLIFSLARDRAFPLSQKVVHLNERDIPDTAIWIVTILSIACICPFPLNEFIFNAIISATTVTANLTYGIVLLCKLLVPIKVRGPFHLGMFSFPVTVLGFIWSVFAVVAFVLPTRWPVTIDNFNYASVGVTTLLVFTLANWWLWARHKYHGPVVHDASSTLYISPTSVA